MTKDIYKQYMYTYPHKSAYFDIDRLDTSAYKSAFVDRAMGLYMHIPFCRHKCGYCNLYSVAGSYNSVHRDYIEAIKRQSAQMLCEIDFSKTDFNSFILGGGTPLIMSVKELEDLFKLAVHDYRLDFDTAFTVIETSPEELNQDKLRLLKEYNFTRLSMGVQSFVAGELRIIERNSDIRHIYKALEGIKSENFDILNVDLIYGMPTQTKENFIYSIKEAVSFDVEEIFLYPLYRQENANLYHKFNMDYEKQFELYKAGRDYLLERGYTQVSMRYFAKNPKLNKDCGFDNTLSLGLGGRSYFDELHFCERYVSGKEDSEKSLARYLEKEDFLSDITYFKLDKDELKRKYIIKNLIYITGLSVSYYKEMFSTDIYEDFPLIKELMANEFVYLKDERLYLRELGYSDYIGPMFISEVVGSRMNFRF